MTVPGGSGYSFQGNSVARSTNPSQAASRGSPASSNCARPSTRDNNTQSEGSGSAKHPSPTSPTHSSPPSNRRTSSRRTDTSTTTEGRLLRREKELQKKREDTL